VRAFCYLLLVSLLLVLIISGCGGSAVPSSPSSPPSPPSPNPLPSVPSPPQNLVGIAGDQEVDLQWQPPASTGSSPITHYTVYRNGKAVATTSSTTYSDRGLTNGVEYQYYVTASNSVGESPPSNVIRVTPNAPTPPAPQISLSVYYPTITDPADARLTGSGTLFTILGKLDVIGGYQSQYTLQALDTDGTVLQSWKVSPGDFRVDLSNFGSPGEKMITLSVKESPLTTAQVPLIVDDSRLQQRAQELIAKGLSPWVTTNIKIYVPESLQGSLQVFQHAADFWAAYSVFRFNVIIGQPSAGEQGYIRIWDKTDEDAWGSARTGWNWDANGRITYAGITVFQGWAIQPDWLKECILAHELWHACFAADEAERYSQFQFGIRFPGYQSSWYSLDQSIIPPIVQHVSQILNPDSSDHRNYHRNVHKRK